MRRQIRTALCVLLALAVSAAAQAQNFSGTFTAKTDDGANVLDLQQAGDSVTGTYAVGPTKLVFSGKLEGEKVKGMATLEGTPVKFAVAFSIDGSKLVAEITEMDENGKPDPHTTEKVVFQRQGSAPTAGPSEPGTKSAGGLNKEALAALADKVKANLKREKADKVLAEGNPPLTVASVAAFAGLMKRCFDADLTETEFETTARHFVKYYDKADGQTKTMLALGWQKILEGISQGTADEQAANAKQVHDVLASRFEAGAKTGMEWAVAMNDAIRRRATKVAAVKGEKPDYAKKAGFHTEMSEADLDAAMEMLYFMWVACGRDTSLVTPQAVVTIRTLIVQNFPTFPPQVQYIFANAQKVYASVRGEWAQATPAHRLQMARAFASGLDQLGLTVPSARGDRISAGGAWSDMNGKSHSAWAGEMVVGLAGSSYNNAWTSH